MARCGKIKRQCLDAGFDHEVARHAGIILEVPLEKPIIRRNHRFTSHEPPAPWATRWVVQRNLVNEKLISGLDFRRPRMRLSPFVSRAKAIESASFAKSNQLLLVERRL